MNRWKTSSLLLLVAALPRCSCDDGEGIERGRVEILLSFAEKDACSGLEVPRRIPDDYLVQDRPMLAPFGAEDELAFEVRSMGSIDLTVDSIALSREDPAYTLSVVNRDGGAATLPTSISPTPDPTEPAALTIKVGLDRAQEAQPIDLIIKSDDREREEIVFTVSPLRGRLEACAGAGCGDDAALDLGGVSIGESADGVIELKNVGEGDLELSRIALEAGTAELCAPEATEVPDAEQCALLSLCRVLKPGESYPVNVSYTPIDGGNDSGVLVVETDGGTTEVPINGAGDGPGVCPCVVESDGSCTPVSSVALGTAEIGMSTSSTIRLESCGTEAVELSEVVLETSGNFATDPAFSIETAFNTGTFAPGEYSEGTVSYSPQDFGEHTGAVRYQIPNRDARWVPLLGRTGGCVLGSLPEIVNFGSVGSGVTAERIVALQNSGTLDCEVTELSDPDNGFYYKNKPAVPFTVRPGQFFDIELSYTAPLRPTIEPESSSIVASSNSIPPGDKLNIPLEVVAGGDQTCRLAVTPGPSSSLFELPTQYALLDFATVPMGYERKLPIVLENAGGADCTISGIEWAFAPNTQLNEFDLEYADGTPVPVGSVTPVTLAPGESANYLATFRPTHEVEGIGGGFIGYIPSETAADCTLFGSPANTCNGVRFLTDDGVTDTSGGGMLGQQDGVFTIGFKAKPTNFRVTVYPESVDFGVVPVGCGSREMTVTVYNQEIHNIDLGMPTVSPNIAPPNQEFEVLGTTGTGTWPETIPPGGLLSISIRFYPHRVGTHTGLLEIPVFEQTNTNPILTVPLTGEGTTDTSRTDVFSQLEDNHKVDILWVMDDSGSMGDDAANVSANTSAFFDVAGVDQLDYHIAVTTTLIGNCEDIICIDDPMSGHYTACAGNDRFVTPMSTNPRQQFECNILVDPPSPFRMGSDGQEGALQAARNFFTQPKIDDPAINGGFLRNDAVLQIVMVSDEPDQSVGSIYAYIDFFRQIKGFRNPDMTRFAVIAMPSMGACSNGDPRYESFAAETNAVWADLCSNDWTVAMENIGNQANALLRSFGLSQTPEPSSISTCVRSGDPSAPCNPVNQTMDGAADGFFFDNTDDSVNFNDGSVPTNSSVVEVTYDILCY